MSDNVKEIQKMIEEAEEDARDIMGELAPRFAPHPLDTTKVKKEDQKFDYENRGPDYWPTLTAKVMADVTTKGGTWFDAVKEVLKHDREMRS